MGGTRSAPPRFLLVKTSATISCLTGADKDHTTCEGAAGQCVLRACRDQVAEFENIRCKSAPDKENCKKTLNACSLAGESCKILACVDKTIGAVTDRRLEMLP